MKTVFILVAMLVSFSVSAQEVCTPEEKPHYYVATGTVKSYVAGLRTFGLVSPAHKDLAACDAALEFLRSQTGIAPKGDILARQSVSYEGYCLAVEICP